MNTNTNTPGDAAAQDDLTFECGRAAGRQEVKDEQTCPDFSTWVRRAYRDPESTCFTIHNMEVAYQAGRAALPAQAVATVADEPVAWVNYPVIVVDGEFAGHGKPVVDFVRLSNGYDWNKSEPLYRPAPVQAVAPTDALPIAWMLEWDDYTEFRSADDMPSEWDDAPPRATPLYAAQPAAQPADAQPLLRAAFRTTEVGGHPDPALRTYQMIFKFRSIEALHAADDEWRAACAAQAATIPTEGS